MDDRRWGHDLAGGDCRAAVLRSVDPAADDAGVDAADPALAAVHRAPRSADADLQRSPCAGRSRPRAGAPARLDDRAGHVRALAPRPRVAAPRGAGGLMRALRLYGHYAAVSIRGQLQYRASF